MFQWVLGRGGGEGLGAQSLGQSYRGIGLGVLKLCIMEHSVSSLLSKGIRDSQKL